MAKIKSNSDDWGSEREPEISTTPKLAALATHSTRVAPAKAARSESPHIFTPTGQPVPKSEEQKAQIVTNIRTEAESVTLPDDYAAAMKLYRQVLRMPETNRRDRMLKRLRKKFVGRHVFKLQQGRPAPDTHPAERFAREDLALASASRLRKERLESLRARIAARLKNSK